MSKTRTFEDVLDECLGRLLVENQTVEQCLQSFPQHSKELKPLLETALAAQKVSIIQPRAEFREQARQQFNSALQETWHRKSRFSFNLGWQPGWATAVAIVLVLSLVGSGTVYAAAGSMPDSPLYTVKLATEQVQITLSFSDLGKAELHARLADKRVTEIVYLSDKDKPEKLALTTERMNTNLKEIAALVSAPDVVSGVAMAPALQQVTTADEAPTPTPATAPEKASAPAQAPTAQTVPASPQVTAVEKAPGAKLQEEQAGKVTPLQNEVEKTDKEEQSPGENEKRDKEESPKVDRRARLKTTVESQANSNTARLRALLETAPESAKPALQRALDQSETEYKKAIEALK